MPEFEELLAELEINLMKAPILNLGCGGFPIEGTINMDSRGDLFRIFKNRYLGSTDPLLVIKQWKWQQGLAYEDNSIDAITESHSLMYLKLEEYETALKECFRVLKPGGMMRVTEDNCENPPELLEKFGIPWGNPASAIGPLTMRIEMEKVGFEVFDCEPPSETRYSSNILIQQKHGTPPRVFHMEGVKPKGE